MLCTCKEKILNLFYMYTVVSLAEYSIYYLVFADEHCRLT